MRKAGCQRYLWRGSQGFLRGHRQQQGCRGKTLVAGLSSNRQLLLSDQQIPLPVRI
jgi:hypothetical protein